MRTFVVAVLFGLSMLGLALELAGEPDNSPSQPSAQPRVAPDPNQL